jgi:hypothetical protein
MRRWEYRKERDGDMDEDLGMLGLAGWELTGVIPGYQSEDDLDGRATLIFKRPILEEAPAPEPAAPGTPRERGRCGDRGPDGHRFCTRYLGHGGPHRARRAWGERQAGIAKVYW